MAAPAPASRWNRFKSMFRRGPVPKVPAGPNSSAVNAAVRKYVQNFRNIQSVARQPNLYGNNFRNLPINRPLIKALRNYINLASNFKKLPAATNQNVGGYGPAKLSKQNVLNAASKVVQAATLANANLANVNKLRTAVATTEPLVATTRQLHSQLVNSNKSVLANNSLQKAMYNSNKKLANLKNALAKAEAAAGGTRGAALTAQAGGTPTPQAVAGYVTPAQNAAFNAFKATLNAYNNSKLNVNKPNNVKMYMNMANLNARREAINKAIANVNLQGRMNNDSKAKLAKVKAMLNRAKNQLNVQAAQARANNAAARNAMTKLVGNYIWDTRAWGGLGGMFPNNELNKIAREIKGMPAFNLSKVNKNSLNAYLGTKTGFNKAHRNRAMAISAALFAPGNAPAAP